VPPLGPTGQVEFEHCADHHVCRSPGYIGGSVLTRLLSHPRSDTFRITVLVRAQEKAAQFRTMGIKAVVGSNADTATLRELAADADLVIACVNIYFFS